MTATSAIDDGRGLEPRPGLLDFTRKPHSAALAFIIAGSFWFAIGTLYGLTTAIHLVAPEFFNNIPALVFGRTRPIHVNTVIYGFIASTSIGTALYYVPALLRTRLWSQPVGWLAWVLWEVSVLSGEVLLPFGITQAREYTEYIWPFDLFITVSVLLLILNLVITVMQRQEKVLYVSVWYVFGMLLWTAGNYPIGNVMWVPDKGAMPGLIDSVFLWFYAHNLVGLLLTPLAIAAAYYVIPRVTGTPLYSHTLSVAGFWALVTFYTHIGGHHILQTPIPNWLKNISVIDSIAMIIPVFIAVSNQLLTARGRFGRLWHDIGGRWVLMGVIFYVVTCIQGPVQSLPAFQKVTHFSNWVIGHSHIAVLGFSGFISIGAMYHVLPYVTRRELYSRKLASLQFGLVLFGVVGFFLVLSAAGLVEGQSWLAGQSVYETMPLRVPFFVARLMVGLFIIVGAWIGFYNLLMTLWRGRRLSAEDLARGDVPET